MKKAEEILKEVLVKTIGGNTEKEFPIALKEDSENGEMLRAFIEAMETYANQSKWISVEDRLPEVNTESFGQNYSLPVLGITEDGEIVQTSVEYSTSEWLGTNFYITITHWQPLPEKP